MSILLKLLQINAFTLLSALWARYAVSAAKPGLGRLVLAAPIVISNCFAPLIFDPVHEFTTHTSYLLLLVWVANFKIIALALNRGSLTHEDLSLSQFVFLYSLPITAQSNAKATKAGAKSNNRINHSAGTNAELAGKWVLKAVLLIVIVYILSSKPKWLPVLLRELTEAFMLYWFLGVLMDGPAALMGWGMGMSISPHFDAPYLSASMSEFWSKRWNLTVGNTLRFLCYDPVHEGRLIASDKPYKVSKLRSAAAICWTFVVSGLMHEFLIWYLEPRAATGEWLTFFVLQGPLLLAETSLKKVCRQHNLSLPRPVSIFLTLLIQLLLADRFFFPPSIRNHLDDRFYNDVKSGVDPLLKACGF